MITVKYLQNEGIVIKCFIVKESSDALATTFCGKAKDLLAKYGGEMLLERRLAEGIYLLIPSMDSSDMMTAWEMTLGRRDIMQEITNTKTLIVEDDQGDSIRAKAKCQYAKDLLEKHKGVVLRQIKVSDSEYRLVIFFPDKTQMMLWKKTLGIC